MDAPPSRENALVRASKAPQSIVACIDVGASQPRVASAKHRAFASEGYPLGPVRTGTVCPEGIRNEGHFVESIAARIAEQSAWYTRKAPLSAAILFMPCPVKNNRTSWSANLRKSEGDGILRDIDYTPLTEHLRKRGVPLAPNFRVVGLNDTLGTALSTVSEVRGMPALRSALVSGTDFAIVYPGGGVGTTRFRRDASTLVIDGSTTGAVEKIQRAAEASGGSVPSLLRNYASEAGIDPEMAVTLGKAELVTQGRLVVDEDKRQALRACNLFQETKSGEFELRDKTRHARASKVAIEKFVSSTIDMAAAQARAGAEFIILLGGLVAGVDTVLKGELASEIAEGVRQQIGRVVPVVTLATVTNNTRGGALAAHVVETEQDYRLPWSCVA